MDHFDAIRLSALHAVIRQDDSEYSLRHIFRWYSKTFATPLHMVDELPLDDVLTAYFETQYEGMKEPQLDAEKAQLIETEAEKKNRIRKQDMDAIQFMETEAIAKSMKDLFGTTKPSTSAMPGLGSMMTEAANSLSGFVDAAKPPAIIQPDIKMTFLNDDQELETDSDSFGLFGKP